MAKKNYTWKLQVEVIEKIQQLAIKEHRSVTNYIELLLIRKIEEEELRMTLLLTSMKKNDETT